MIILFIVAAFVAEQRGKSKQTSIELPIYGDVTSFSVTNQLGQLVTKESLKGKVWVANIIFTRCPGPCAQMTRQMAELQKAVAADLPVQFISLTTDPEFDNPQILAEYGKKFGADARRWWFLTGTKRDMINLAVQGLKLTTIEKPEGQRDIPEDLFIHSAISVLVDGQGRGRKTFEVLPPETEVSEEQVTAYKQEKVQQIRQAIEQLLKEGAKR